MVYGKKDLDLLDILYLAYCYVSLICKFMYIKKMMGVIVLFLLSVLRQAEVE